MKLRSALVLFLFLSLLMSGCAEDDQTIDPLLQDPTDAPAPPPFPAQHTEDDTSADRVMVTGGTRATYTMQWPEHDVKRTIDVHLRGETTSRSWSGETVETYAITLTADGPLTRPGCPEGMTCARTLTYHFARSSGAFVSTTNPEERDWLTDEPYNQSVFPNVTILTIQPHGIFALVPPLHDGLRDVDGGAWRTTFVTGGPGKTALTVEDRHASASSVYTKFPLPDLIEVSGPIPNMKYKLASFSPGDGPPLVLGVAGPTETAPLPRTASAREWEAFPGRTIVVPPVIDLERADFNASAALLAAVMKPTVAAFILQHERTFLFEVRYADGTWKINDDDRHGYDPLGTGIFEAMWQFGFTALPIPASAFDHEALVVGVAEYRLAHQSVFDVIQLEYLTYGFSGEGLSDPTLIRSVDLADVIELYEEWYPGREIRMMEWVALDVSDQGEYQQIFGTITTSCGQGPDWVLLFDLYSGRTFRATHESGGSCGTSTGAPWS